MAVTVARIERPTTSHTALLTLACPARCASERREGCIGSPRDAKVRAALAKVQCAA
jgi:hypothetical protein